MKFILYYLIILLEIVYCNSEKLLSESESNFESQKWDSSGFAVFCGASWKKNYICEDYYKSGLRPYNNNSNTLLFPWLSGGAYETSVFIPFYPIKGKDGTLSVDSWVNILAVGSDNFPKITIDVVLELQTEFNSINFTVLSYSQEEYTKFKFYTKIHSKYINIRLNIQKAILWINLKSSGCNWDASQIAFVFGQIQIEEILAQEGSFPMYNFNPLFS